MCASYGLGGPRAPWPVDVPILDDKESDAALRAWIRETGGKANTTRATNWNPVVVGAEQTVELAWWWLWLGGRPAQFTAFNSRDDALVQKWKAPFQHRALLPVTWYSEGKKSWALPGGEPFMLAAITAPRGVEDEGPRLSYSLVTRHGIGEASTVKSARGESRMPLIVPSELQAEWLDPARAGDKDLVDLVVHASAELSHAVTTGEVRRDSVPTLF